MKIGLLLNSNNKLCTYSERYKDILSLKNIPFTLIDPNSNNLLDELQACTHLIFRHSQGDTDIKLYDTIFNIARNIYGVKCYPNFETFWPYEDKIKEYYLLKSTGFPIIESNPFWNFHHAEQFLKTAQFPFVAKLPKGAGSSNVVIVNSINDGEKIINQIFNKGVKSRGLNTSSNLSSIQNAGTFKYGKKKLRNQLIKLGLIRDRTDYPEWQLQKDSILFQKYLPDNQSDTRVTVIGNRAFAFRRFVRKNDFRASGSGNFNIDPDNIDLRCISIAFSISAKLNFNTMAYDFIYEEGKPFINEISYCFVDLIVQKCPGYWDNSLNWHPGHFWPQECQIEDFIKT